VCVAIRYPVELQLRLLLAASQPERNLEEASSAEQESRKLTNFPDGNAVDVVICLPLLAVVREAKYIEIYFHFSEGFLRKALMLLYTHKHTHTHTFESEPFGSINYFEAPQNLIIIIRWQRKHFKCVMKRK